MQSDRFENQTYRAVRSARGKPLSKSNPRAGRDSSGPSLTRLQGQYLAFIRAYTLIHRIAPAEADMQRFFAVTPPSVHQMVLTLEQRGLIDRVPGQARSIRVLVPAEELPSLEDPIAR